MKNRNEIKKQRDEIKRSCEKVTKIYKNDNRVTNSSRICAVCGKRLTRLNRTNGKAQVVFNHYHIKFSELIQCDICLSLSDCVKYLKGGE